MFDWLNKSCVRFTQVSAAACHGDFLKSPYRNCLEKERLG